jgi:hypothetical protein
VRPPPVVVVIVFAVAVVVIVAVVVVATATAVVVAAAAPPLGILGVVASFAERQETPMRRRRCRERGGERRRVSWRGGEGMEKIKNYRTAAFEEDENENDEAEETSNAARGVRYDGGRGG